MNKTFRSIFVLITFGGSILLAQQTTPDTSKQQSQQAEPEINEAQLEAEIAEELGETDTTATDVQSSTRIRSAATQRSSVINPQISVIGSFLAKGTEDHAVVKPIDGGLNEAEFSFQAYVDPYSKADFYIGFGNEGEDPFEGPDSGAAGNGEFEAELEEAYLTSLSLPFGLQVKAGKFRSNFGKINQIHPHALNYIDMPRMYANYLGGEGLGDKGIAVNWLVPNPLNFFQELSVEVTSGALEGPSFAGGSSNLLYLGHLKNFFDLSESSTLELGFTGMYGANNEIGDKTSIGAADLTFKWKPLRYNRYKSFEWTTEALVSDREMAVGSETSLALYSHLRYQVAKRWYVGGRYDYSEFPTSGDINETAYSGILSFFATEYQKIELQFQHAEPAERDSFSRALLRAVFVIGAHGAHKY